MAATLIINLLLSSIMDNCCYYLREKQHSYFHFDHSNNKHFNKNIEIQWRIHDFFKEGTNGNFSNYIRYILIWINSNSSLLFLNRLLQVAPKWRIKSIKKLLLLYKRSKKVIRRMRFVYWESNA